MKVGDLVWHLGHFWAACGIVLYDNDEGGTLKILDQETGKVIWVVKSECEALNEAR